MTIDRHSVRRGHASRPRGRQRVAGGRGAALRFAAPLSAAAALTLAPPAEAQDKPPIDRVQMTEDMHTYFHGEKWEGPVFVGAGLAAAGVGAVLVTRNDNLARGAAFPVFGIGLGQLIVGAVVFFRTDAQVARLDRQLTTDPAAFKKDEGARLARINSQITALMIVESVLIAAGTVTAVVAAQKECCQTLQGVGLGIAAEGATTLALDLFVAARARRYADSLQRFDAGSPVAPSPAAPAPMSVSPISLGWRF